MRALIQRVSRARVLVDGETVGDINKGLLVMIGITHDDTPEQAIEAPRSMVLVSYPVAICSRRSPRCSALRTVPTSVTIPVNMAAA